ncbi:MAG: hypothetical protein KC486_13240 [Myxococcales bacterium]|nr:hypothetical protein [Myxococcales bacterium]
MSIQILLCFVVGLLVIGFSLYNHPAAKRRRHIRSVPIVPIAELEIGTRARISGSIELLDGELVGPLTGRRCVHYGVAVYEEEGYDERKQWVAIGCDRRAVDFVVRDSSGAVLVRVARAEIDAGCDHSSRSGFLDDPNANELALLERFNEHPERFILNRKLKYTEGVLEVGEEVTVVGIVRVGVDGFTRVIEAPPDGTLIVTDHRRTVHALPRAAA